MFSAAKDAGGKKARVLPQQVKARARPVDVMEKPHFCICIIYASAWELTDLSLCCPSSTFLLHFFTLLMHDIIVFWQAERKGVSIKQALFRLNPGKSVVIFYHVLIDDKIHIHHKWLKSGIDFFVMKIELGLKSWL